MKALITLLAFALPFASFGEAAYFNKNQAIRNAEIIAIVDVQSVKPAGKKSESWTYSEVAEGKVERVLKGELPGTVRLHGGEDFICAQVKYKPGKHLLFLRRDKELLVGANWQLGVLPITGDSVQWFENDKSIELKPASLRTAIEEIESAMEKDWPILVHQQVGGRNPVPRLKFAYWQDGTVLLRGDDDQVLVGSVERSEFGKLWSTLREATFFAGEHKSFLAVDVGYDTIKAHLGSESATHSFNVGLKPRTPETANRSPERLKFIEMWEQSAAAITELRPRDSKPVSEVAKEGKFRGYVLDRPNETEWLNKIKWKRMTEGK